MSSTVVWTESQNSAPSAAVTSESSSCDTEVCRSCAELQKAASSEPQDAVAVASDSSIKILATLNRLIVKNMVKPRLANASEMGHKVGDEILGLAEIATLR